MLKTIKTLSFAAAFSIAGGLAAQATTFNFANLADTIGESTWGGSSVSTGWGGNGGGLVVGASATTRDGDPASAYLDAGNAGLGVCSGTITATYQCDPSNDDNVGTSPGGANDNYDNYETLALDFSQEVSLTSLTLRDSNHGLLSAGDEIWIYNATANFAAYFTVGVSNLLDWGVGSTWWFEMALAPNHTSTAFYISSLSASPIPVPAGGLLLLTALGGMAAARRRRKAA